MPDVSAAAASSSPPRSSSSVPDGSGAASVTANQRVAKFTYPAVGDGAADDPDRTVYELVQQRDSEPPRRWQDKVTVRTAALPAHDIASRKLAELVPSKNPQSGRDAGGFTIKPEPQLADVIQEQKHERTRPLPMKDVDLQEAVRSVCDSWYRSGRVREEVQPARRAEKRAAAVEQFFQSPTAPPTPIRDHRPTPPVPDLSVPRGPSRREAMRGMRLNSLPKPPVTPPIRGGLSSADKTTRPPSPERAGASAPAR